MQKNETRLYLIAHTENSKWIKDLKCKMQNHEITERKLGAGP